MLSRVGIQTFLKRKKEDLYLPSALCFFTPLSHLHPRLLLLSNSSSRKWDTFQVRCQLKSFASHFQFLYELTCGKCVCARVFSACVCVRVRVSFSLFSSIHPVFISELFCSTYWSNTKDDHTLKYVRWIVRCLTHATLFSACVWPCVWFTWLTEYVTWHCMHFACKVLAQVQCLFTSVRFVSSPENVIGEPNKSLAERRFNVIVLTNRRVGDEDQRSWR